jgi:hypothetical protein
VKQVESRALLIIQPWHFPPKHRLTFNGLHGVISQKIKLFNDRYIVCSASYRRLSKARTVMDWLDTGILGTHPPRTWYLPWVSCHVLTLALFRSIRLEAQFCGFFLVGTALFQMKRILFTTELWPLHVYNVGVMTGQHMRGPLLSEHASLIKCVPAVKIT